MGQPKGEGERGKYYRAYRDGHSVRVVQEDGTADVRYFTLEDGAVILEPDVREYFPTSESVNEALRALISLIPSKPAKKTASGKAPRRKLKT